MPSVSDAAKTGDQRKTLEALRDSLAAAFDEASTNVQAQIAAQLRATLADISALPGTANPAPVGVVTIEDAKAKRAARQQQAATPPAAKTGSRKRG